MAGYVFCPFLFLLWELVGCVICWFVGPGLGSGFVFYFSFDFFFLVWGCYIIGTDVLNGNKPFLLWLSRDLLLQSNYTNGVAANAQRNTF